jgi:hypothetical protein
MSIFDIESITEDPLEASVISSYMSCGFALAIVALPLILIIMIIFSPYLMYKLFRSDTNPPQEG